MAKSASSQLRRGTFYEEYHFSQLDFQLLAKYNILITK